MKKDIELPLRTNMTKINRLVDYLLDKIDDFAEKEKLTVFEVFMATDMVHVEVALELREEEE